ncbi:MAG: YlbF family regulator [Hydrogenoanaerobacterium sp.]
MDVITLARELGAAIQNDERYVHFNDVKTAADNDKELQDMIGNFNLKRLALSNAVSDEAPDQTKLEELDRELKALYDTVMGNTSMIAFNESKKDVDEMMGFVNQILTASINGDDPMTVEQADACSGSCDSCGGCH